MEMTPMIIIIAILLFACIILGVWYTRQTGAKKEAQKILAAGHITNRRTFERTLRLLSGMKNDLEAAELKKGLLALEKKGG